MRTILTKGNRKYESLKYYWEGDLKVQTQSIPTRSVKIPRCSSNNDEDRVKLYLITHSCNFIARMRCHYAWVFLRNCLHI